MPTEEIKIKKCYIVKLSIGFDVQIDASELSKVLMAWKNGSIEQLKQGFIRGDLIGAIIADTERTSQITDNFDSRTGKKIAGELRPLKDIFKDIKLLPGQDQKKLK